MAAPMTCDACDFTTTVVYDAACHFYALGHPHTVRTRPAWECGKCMFATENAAAAAQHFDAESGHHAERVR